MTHQPRPGGSGTRITASEVLATLDEKERDEQIADLEAVHQELVERLKYQAGMA